MIDRYTVVMSLPKDLGDCLICTPAINAVIKYCEKNHLSLVAVGGKLQRGWIETLSGAVLPYRDVAEIEGLKPRFAVNFNFHDEDMIKKLSPDTKVYAPEKMTVVNNDTFIFGEGAIVGKKHIAKSLNDCLKAAGVIAKSVKLGAPVLSANIVSEEARNNALAEFGIKGPYAALVPVCAVNRPWKRWQPERFAEIAKKAAAEGITPVLFGGPSDDEKKLTAEINEMSGGVCKTVHANIDKVAALMSGTKFTLSNDTGLFHIAAAAGKPTFGLFGYYNDHNTWRPAQKNSYIINGDKIQNLSVDDVYKTIKSTIEINSTKRVFNSAAAKKAKSCIRAKLASKPKF